MASGKTGHAVNSVHATTWMLGPKQRFVGLLLILSSNLRSTIKGSF